MAVPSPSSGLPFLLKMEFKAPSNSGWEESIYWVANLPGVRYVPAVVNILARMRRAFLDETVTLSSVTATPQFALGTTRALGSRKFTGPSSGVGPGTAPRVQDDPGIANPWTAREVTLYSENNLYRRVETVRGLPLAATAEFVTPRNFQGVQVLKALDEYICFISNGKCAFKAAPEDAAKVPTDGALQRAAPRPRRNPALQPAGAVRPAVTYSVQVPSVDGASGSAGVLNLNQGADRFNLKVDPGQMASDIINSVLKSVFDLLGGKQSPAPQQQPGPPVSVNAGTVLRGGSGAIRGFRRRVSQAETVGQTPPQRGGTGPAQAPTQAALDEGRPPLRGQVNLETGAGGVVPNQLDPARTRIRGPHRPGFHEDSGRGQTEPIVKRPTPNHRTGAFEEIVGMGKAMSVEGLNETVGSASTGQLLGLAQNPFVGRPLIVQAVVQIGDIAPGTVFRVEPRGFFDPRFFQPTVVASNVQLRTAPPLPVGFDTVIGQDRLVPVPINPPQVPVPVVVEQAIAPQVLAADAAADAALHTLRNRLLVAAAGAATAAVTAHYTFRNRSQNKPAGGTEVLPGSDGKKHRINVKGDFASSGRTVVVGQESPVTVTNLNVYQFGSFCIKARSK